MKTSFIDINFSFIEKEEIISKKGLISSFEDTIGNQKIELAYRFVEEQYRERILLNLELLVDNKNILEDFSIGSTVELPHQYPANYQLMNKAKNLLAIQHSLGIYVVNLITKETQLVRYKTNSFQHGYFSENYLIIVENKAAHFIT